jgi:branched-chain amino acid transport system ATP-binding protein
MALHPPGNGLAVRGLRAGYGDMEVVKGIDLEVPFGKVVVLVGRNGAGKTTALAALAGIRFSAPAGSVRLGELDLSRASAMTIVRSGVAFVPAGHRVFASLSVEENLKMGLFPWRRRPRAHLDQRMAHVYELFPALEPMAGRLAGQLSGGQQQMLAIGQALMADPRILMLDEPSSGLAPLVVDLIYAAILASGREGRGVLFVDQDVDRGLAQADYGYVMDDGQLVLSGPSRELRDNPRVAQVVRGTGISRDTTPPARSGHVPGHGVDR